MFYVCSTTETANFHFIVRPSVVQGQINYIDPPALLSLVGNLPIPGSPWHIIAHMIYSTAQKMGADLQMQTQHAAAVCPLCERKQFVT